MISGRFSEAAIYKILDFDTNRAGVTRDEIYAVTVTSVAG